MPPMAPLEGTARVFQTLARRAAWSARACVCQHCGGIGSRAGCQCRRWAWLQGCGDGIPAMAVAGKARAGTRGLGFFAQEMHVDGFRFDLASILTRAHSNWHQTGVGTTKPITPVSPDGQIMPASSGPHCGTPLSDPPLIRMIRCHAHASPNAPHLTASARFRIDELRRAGGWPCFTAHPWPIKRQVVHRLCGRTHGASPKRAYLFTQ